MYKIKLRLFPAQFAALVATLPDPKELTAEKAANIWFEELILLDYRTRLSWTQVFTWRGRPADKRFTVTLPLLVARALWSELQLQNQTADSQTLLNELDQALVNAGFSNSMYQK